MAAQDEFTVVVSGEPFSLSRSQIEYDSPNYFTELFTGDTSQVVRYLSGYSVLPLDAASVPPGLSVAQASRNLLEDARFLGLAGLVDQLGCLNAPDVPLSPAVLRSFGLHPARAILFDALLRDGVPDGLVFGSKGLSTASEFGEELLLVVARNLPLVMQPDGNWNGSRSLHVGFRSADIMTLAARVTESGALIANARTIIAAQALINIDGRSFPGHVVNKVLEPGPQSQRSSDPIEVTGQMKAAGEALSCVKPRSGLVATRLAFVLAGINTGTLTVWLYFAECLSPFNAMVSAYTPKAAQNGLESYW